ncbi:MAG: ABC transporter ATP-binding protein [Dehalococcoidia bacterium]|jgi:tungstate transport system ATP-binding protein|nr:ABC transporter ATP-binding protein [Dehalococcoidia bacterium]
MTALTFRDIRVRRGPREVLRVPALDVTEGETLALLGPNGAGKSTLLLTGALLLDLAEGQVALFDEPALDGRARVRQRRLTATVFQEPALLDMSARRNIETALALHEVPRTDRRARSDHWLARLGVAHLAEALPHTLSGGEAQRVALARAFAVEPRLLFLDEPFSSLDSGTRAELVGELRTLLADEATTTLLVTHDLSETQLLADRVAVLLDGNVAQHGTVEVVLERPLTPAVASFLGYSLIEAMQLPTAVTAAAAIPTSASDIALRPSAVRLVSDATEVKSVYRGDASIVAVQGAHGRGRLLLDLDGARIAADLPIEVIRSFEVGAVVTIEIDPRGLVSW